MGIEVFLVEDFLQRDSSMHGETHQFGELNIFV